MPLLRISLPLALIFVGSTQLHSLDGQVIPRGMPVEIGAPEVNGLYVNPVPNAPFTATVQILSSQKLSDGSTITLRLVNHIARDSKGRTYGESRHFVANDFKGDPPIDAIYIYDPASRVETHLDPALMVEWAVQLAEPMKPREGTVPADESSGVHSGVTTEQLAPKTVDGLELHGTRQSQDLIVNEFWYSPDLSMCMSRKHVDSTWEQTFTATQIVRGEPEASLFAIPPCLQADLRASPLAVSLGVKWTQTLSRRRWSLAA